MKNTFDHKQNQAATGAKLSHPGEQFYSTPLSWDAHIQTGTLPKMLEEATRQFGDQPVIEYCGRQIQ